MSYSNPAGPLRGDRTLMQQEYPYFTNIYPSTALMVIDSDDRIAGDAFNFLIDLQTETAKCRQLQLKRVIMPKINNVVEGIQMQIKHDLGTTALFNLTPGMYNPSSLCNMLTLVINAAFVTAGIADTVTCSYDQIERTITISSVNGDNFFIVDSCSFITYGLYFAPFPSQPLAAIPATSSITSGVCGLLPFRYLMILSDELCGYSKIRSVTSDSVTSNNLLGVIDVCSLYPPEVFAVGTVFPGVYQTLELPNSPILRTEASNVQAPRNIYIRLQDDFGRFVNSLFPANSKLSMMLEIEMTY